MLAVAVAAAAAMVTAAVTVAAVAAMDNEDGIQWRRWGGRSMAVAAFNSNGNGLRIGNSETKMAINTSSGRWQWRASAFDSSDGRRWVSVFDSGNGQQLWQQWTIEMAFNGSSGSGI
jgi:hypothetical protein